MRGEKIYEEIGLTSIIVIDQHRTFAHKYGKERYTEEVIGIGADGKFFSVNLTYIYPPRALVPACRSSDVKPRVSLVEISKERYDFLKARKKS
ncbi:MAG: hypothetical protein P1P90_00295 [Patescibacteria group bacterium]|nr:hypothetical protein [Patescibacteria group bacterium]